MFLAGLSIFFGSFLLFGIQPMMGRTLLPSFGGTASVWTACLVAYQVLLLVGYGYAHGVAKLAPKTQRRLHVALLFLSALWSLAFAFCQQAVRAMIGNSGLPSLEVVLAVCLIVGLPYTLLSSGSSLMQSWLATAKRHGGHDDRGVYKLYAVSNLGSFIGLFVHPLILEPFVAVSWQWRGFALAMFAYALFVGFVAVRQRTALETVRNEDLGESTPPGRTPAGVLNSRRLKSRILWFALPCLSSFFLVATSNQLTLDISPMPLMWAVVLGLFLLSYVIGFSSAGEKLLPLWMLLAAASLAAMAVATLASVDVPSRTMFTRTLELGLPSFLFVLVFIHSWLYSIRPSGKLLTKYYLGNAAGGALGGILAGVVSPAVFNKIVEYPLALILLAVVFVWFIREYWHPKMANGLNQLAIIACLLVPLHIFFMPKGLIYKDLFEDRGFYGVVSVLQKISADDKAPTIHTLFHGRTDHGFQVRSGKFSKQPTSYYTAGGGGIALYSHPKHIAGEPLRFGGVGLGIGVMATYGREGDTYRFYEISPEVINIATNSEWFSFVNDCKADLEIVEGDARKSLEREQTAGDLKYDVLVVDAFNGDSIPMQMATDEAFDLYRKRLADGGILAVHISNWQFDLYPLCKAQMVRTGMFAVGIVGKLNTATWAEESGWVFFSEKPFKPVYQPELTSIIDWSKVESKASITDEKGSLLSFLMRFSPLQRDKPRRK